MPDERAALTSPTGWNCCSWLILLRPFGLAISVQFLLLAMVGTLLASASWWVTGRIFYGESPTATLAAYPTEEAASFAATRLRLERWPGERRANLDEVLGSNGALDIAWGTLQGEQTEPFMAAWRNLSEPFARLFSLQVDLRMFAYFLCGGLLTLVVWAICGGAIVRSAAVQLGREQRVGLTESVAFSISKLGAFIAAPLFSLIGIAGIALLVAILGLLMWVADFGVLIAGLLWILVLIGSFLMTILGIGLLFGWPLMWGTIGAEGTDAFDALSRSYAYTYQRPLHYLFYVLVAGLLGALGWMLVWGFAETVVHLGLWAASWGAGVERIEQIDGNVAGGATYSLSVGAWLIGFWNAAARTVAYAFGYSYFWTVAAAIYLLLRRDVDQTELDEVYLDDEAELESLPALVSDEAGVPGVAEPDSADEERPADENAGQEGP